MLRLVLLACLLSSSCAWPALREQGNTEKNATSPFSLDWDNSVAICAIMRQENVEDLREWLQYHRYVQKPAQKLRAVSMFRAHFERC